MTMKKIGISATAGAALGALAMSIAVPQIQGEEGLKDRAYRDVAGVLTICSGHTGPDVMLTSVKTDEQCYTLTLADAKKAADEVLKVNPHLIFHPMQLAAAISFSFNVGIGNYDTSSVSTDFNMGNFSAACDDMGKWIYITNPQSHLKEISQGLVNRREKEMFLCKSTLTKDLYNASISISPVT